MASPSALRSPDEAATRALEADPRYTSPAFTVSVPDLTPDPSREIVMDLTYEGAWSGEGENRRKIEPDSVDWPVLPVPFLAQDDILPHHAGSEVVGRIDEITRVEIADGITAIRARGYLGDWSNAQLAAQWIREGYSRSVSIDMAEPEAAKAEDGVHITKGRVIGGTLTPFLRTWAEFFPLAA